MGPQTLGHDPLDLDALYDPPAEHIRQAVMPELIDFHIRYLEKATFFCLATGRVTDDATVRMELAEGGKAPKTAIIVMVDEVLFHCGKALNRARLRDPASRLARGSLPTPGQMLAAMTRKSMAEAEAIDAHYDHAMRTDLYG
ncbi:hypothetical protein [Nitrospirillum viridazoti]|uniref:Uncharacterized protein n=1 Tax=Nitrospirillum amazonense TaxID=28077 RepID=A0A560J3B3_9PROT|nr:hypothetical protein [Nitrospirillum amazonense]TWB63724.1 hypothetical protein FBZ92_103216 [Nitrospirillum amazonense]